MPLMQPTGVCQVHAVRSFIDAPQPRSSAQDGAARAESAVRAGKERYHAKGESVVSGGAALLSAGQAGRAMEELGMGHEAALVCSGNMYATRFTRRLGNSQSCNARHLFDALLPRLTSIPTPGTRTSKQPSRPRYISTHLLHLLTAFHYSPAEPGRPPIRLFIRLPRPLLPIAPLPTARLWLPLFIFWRRRQRRQPLRIPLQAQRAQPAHSFLARGFRPARAHFSPRFRAEHRPVHFARPRGAREPRGAEGNAQGDQDALVGRGEYVGAESRDDQLGGEENVSRGEQGGVAGWLAGEAGSGMRG